MDHQTDNSPQLSTTVPSAPGLSSAWGEKRQRERHIILLVCAAEEQFKKTPEGGPIHDIFEDDVIGRLEMDSNGGAWVTSEKYDDIRHRVNWRVTRRWRRER